MKKYCVFTLLIGCCLWLTLPAGAADAELENWRTFSSPAPAQKIKVACIEHCIKGQTQHCHRSKSANISVFYD